MRPFLTPWLLTLDHSVLRCCPWRAWPSLLLAPERWALWLTLIVAIAEFVLALGLWWAFDPDNGGMQFAV